VTALIDDHDAISTVIRLFLDGESKGDAAKLMSTCHPDARMYGRLGSDRADMPISELAALSAKYPLDTDGRYRGRIISINQVGDAAVATVAEDHCWGSVSFVDFLSLARCNGHWKIVNKTFEHTGGEPPPM
jgi:hypothetical protein